MKSCVIVGNWADGALCVHGSFPSHDAAREWAKGEELLGRLKAGDWTVKPFKAVERNAAFEMSEGPNLD